MILVGKKTILDEIEDAAKGFSVMEECPLDFIILSDHEWEELVKLKNLKSNVTEFAHKGVVVVRDGHIPKAREHRHYVKEVFR